MKWVRYESQGQARYGQLEGDTISEIDGLPWGTHSKTGKQASLAQVKLLHPVVPGTFYAAGLNYISHRKKRAERTGEKLDLPKQQDLGYRAANALIGPEEAIVIPKDSSGKVQFEGELVVIIGKKAKHVAESDVASVIFGYTIGNDVSERPWQRGDRTSWRGKNSDTFSPMGPYIETELGSLDALTTRVRLNGKEVANFKTNDMLFSVAPTIAMLTRYCTVYPGDIIMMGTDEPTLDMVPGDVVEVEINGLGVLRNPVVGEK